MEQEHMNIRELLHLDWDSHQGLPKLMTGAPLTSLADENRKPEHVPAPYRFRLTGDGKRIVILCNDPVYTGNSFPGPEFLDCNPDDRTKSRIVIPYDNSASGKTELIDFLPANEQGLFLLERVTGGGKESVHRLRKTDAAGKTLWSVESAAEPSGNDDLLAGKNIAFIREAYGALYLQAELSGKTRVLRAETATGATTVWAAMDRILPRVFIGDERSLYYVTFINEANNRAYVRYERATGKTDIHYAGPATYAPLGFPAAADSHNNLYCTEGLTLTCLTPQLDIIWKFSANSFVPVTDQLLSSHYDAEDKALLVRTWDTAGNATGSTRIPLDLPGIRLAKLTRVHGADDWEVEVFQGNNKSYQRYQPQSRNLAPLPQSDGREGRYYLQAAATWQIDQAGALYLAVSGDDGFRIIKIVHTGPQPGK